MGNVQVNIAEEKVSVWRVITGFLNDDSEEISSDDVIRNSGMPQKFIDLLTKKNKYIKCLEDAMSTHSEEKPKRKSNNTKPKIEADEIVEISTGRNVSSKEIHGKERE